LIGKFWPKKAKEIKPDVKPVADLDAIIAEPIPFRFKGKIHLIKPIELEEYLKFANAQSDLMQTSEEDGSLPAKILAEKYHRVISAVCDTISLDDVLSMSQAQVAALYQLVIDAITGQVDKGDGKKKRLKIPIYEYAQASSLKSAAQHSVGRPNKL